MQYPTPPASIEASLSFFNIVDLTSNDVLKDFFRSNIARVLC